MKRRINIKYIENNFNFNLDKEKAIYSYLCGERLNRKQKKILNDSIRFGRYSDWRKYQFGNYSKYSKESLIEFDKVLNLYLRDINQNKNIYQIFISSFISVILSRFFTEYVNMSNENIISMIVWNVSLPFLIAMLLVLAYKSLYDETRYIPFFEDMKEVIEEIINQK